MAKLHGGMGFKDLTAFNLAMLGKQGWKLLTEPDSLVSRIFKAGYFPSGTYLTAQLGHNPSYVWRSILRAHIVVRGGSCWCIGSGESIPLLDAPWLHDGRCIDSRIPGAQYMQGLTVAHFLQPDSKCWNSQLVQQVFSADIAADILHTSVVEQVQ